MKTTDIIVKVFTYIFLTLAAFVCIFPFVWMVFGATMSTEEVASGTLKVGSDLIENFKLLTENEGYFSAFWNSTWVALATTGLALLISSIAAYSFEMYSSKGKDRLFGALLLTMMVPFAALMIPLYRITILINLNNTHLSLILPAVATVFLIFFFRQSLKSFPREIIQSARIDGAGELRTYISIVMPSMRPTFAAAAILTFMTSWNNFLWPLITLSTREKATLPLKISSLGTSYTPEYGVILLAIVIATIPSIIVFFALQRHFVAGLTGAVK